MNNGIEMRNMRKWTIAGFACGATGLLCMVAAAAMVFGFQMGQASDSESLSFDTPLVLNADSAVKGKSLSMASGLIDARNGLDGLFVLDHLTGELQCWLVNPKTLEAAVIKVDAGAALNPTNAGKADYMMITGKMDFAGARGGVGGLTPGNCICYVADSNSGKIVGYGVSYNRAGQGEFNVVVSGVSRGQVVRDQ